ncbi:hypothetical protein LTR62_005572 [Meristemomyces frigidus]|uniref:SAM and PH domain-containing protein n=1 Tax=Meristemomyces frigidus TaxID=1508187 RepID=A0AAN7TDS3_9PEZI|nr:hypothetical protein LTR62_005572 [Meristemomyces frigidus]
MHIIIAARRKAKVRRYARAVVMGNARGRRSQYLSLLLTHGGHLETSTTAAPHTCIPVHSSWGYATTDDHDDSSTGDYGIASANVLKTRVLVEAAGGRRTTAVMSSMAATSGYLAHREDVHRQTKTTSLAESAFSRPFSLVSEMNDTDFEDESDSDDFSPKLSFDTDARRTSQTTLSSYDEAPTPSSSQGQRPFELRFKPVEGPRGPHLFRASQTSVDLGFDYALQMSPLLPKLPPLRTDTAFSQATITPVTRQSQMEEDFSIASALHKALNQSADGIADPTDSVRNWTSQQVVDWMYATGIDEHVINCFDRHDVDGAVISDIQFDELKELDIHSFGKRHQVWSAICELRGDEARLSPQPTPFQDISRPCTTTNRRSPSRSRNTCEMPVDGDAPVTPVGGKKRRGRKASKRLDVITPAESVSIVAIEQLLPKPHTCNKGENCAKWRKQQRELQQLKDENGIGRFPISPGKGGRVFVRGDPGNATTADNIIPNVRLQPMEDHLRPTSDVVPSVVASSDLLGQSQLPDFLLHADMLDNVDRRDPQDNVRQFLNFQHLNYTAPPLDDSPPTPPADLYQGRGDVITRSESVPPLFPTQHHQAYPSLNTPAVGPRPHQQLRGLPRLDIPIRSATAGPDLRILNSALATAVPESAVSICRSVTASPIQVYRLGTPASEVDVPLTAIPTGPISRNTSASVPPNMQFRQQQPPIARSASRADHWRRPSLALPAVKEGEVFSPSSNPRPNPAVRSKSDTDSSTLEKFRDPAHHPTTTQHLGYGPDCTHAGWMKKRKNKLLRHEWTDAHFRLTGSNLGMYPNAVSQSAKETINVDDYSVACSSVASSSKLGAAMKAFKILSDEQKNKEKLTDATAFAFQLVPSQREVGKVLVKNEAGQGKTHHFAVKTKDERIDWMRELMLAKALRAKKEGYEVEVNGVLA